MHLRTMHFACDNSFTLRYVNAALPCPAELFEVRPWMFAAAVTPSAKPGVRFPEIPTDTTEISIKDLRSSSQYTLGIDPNSSPLYRATWRRFMSSRRDRSNCGQQCGSATPLRRLVTPYPRAQIVTVTKLFRQQPSIRSKRHPHRHYIVGGQSARCANTHSSGRSVSLLSSAASQHVRVRAVASTLDQAESPLPFRHLSLGLIGGSQKRSQSMRQLISTVT